MEATLIDISSSRVVLGEQFGGGGKDPEQTWLMKGV